MPDLIISAATEGGYVVREETAVGYAPKILFAGGRVALINWLMGRLENNDRAVEQRHVINFANVT